MTDIQLDSPMCLVKKTQKTLAWGLEPVKYEVQVKVPFDWQTRSLIQRVGMHSSSDVCRMNIG